MDTFLQFHADKNKHFLKTLVVKPQGFGHTNETLPAVYTSEEHSLSFVRRPHLPRVVNHPLLVTAGTTPVRLKGSGTAKRSH